MSHDLTCFRCGASLASLSLPLSRRDECPECSAHLHVCRMCRYFDPTAVRQCLEDDAEDVADKDRLYGYLDGGGKVILPEPQPLLTRASKMPGLDGQKMSKSYGNTISLRAAADVTSQQLRTMPTDPARVRRSDPGDPAKCPVWQFHEVYSDEQMRDWVRQGCTTASIGCIDCKQPVIDAVLEELRPIQERAREFEGQPELVRNIINEGCETAREEAHETMDIVRHAMSLETV
jgi:tryptophanyl-tRNA synthetase